MFKIKIRKKKNKKKMIRKPLNHHKTNIELIQRRARVGVFRVGVIRFNYY